MIDKIIIESCDGNYGYYIGMYGYCGDKKEVCLATTNSEKGLGIIATCFDGGLYEVCQHIGRKSAIKKYFIGMEDE